MNTLILGLLMLKDLTVYEIQRFLKQGMYLMYSDSMGSIQVAIKKLVKEEFIIYTEQVGNGKIRKIYTITDAGKEHFNNWLSQPITSKTAQNRVLTKLFFMGLLPKEEREPLIRGYIDILEEKKVELESSFQEAKSVELDTTLKDISTFQLATIQLSIDSLKFEIDWYKTFVNTIIDGQELE